jgi:protein required for attachment to host cells
MTEVHIPARALVLVGDGRRALFLRNRGTPRNVELVVEREMEHEDAPTRELGTDRPGRKPGTDGVSRSAIEEVDRHQQAETRFASDVASALYQMEHAHQFDELVVVAPPRMLGDLRAALHPEVEARIVAEVAKDLVSHPVPELARLLLN